MTADDFQRKCEHLKEFRQQHQQLIQQYSRVENHPWFGLTACDLSPIDQDDFLGNARIWSKVLKQLQIFSQQAAEILGVTQQYTLANLNQLQQQLGRCPKISPLVQARLLPVLKTSQAQNSVTKLLNQIKKYKENRECLMQYFQNEIISLSDLSHLENLLTKLETIEIYEDQNYTIADLKDLGQQTAEISRQFEQYNLHSAG